MWRKTYLKWWAVIKFGVKKDPISVASVITSGSFLMIIAIRDNNYFMGVYTIFMYIWYIRMVKIQLDHAKQEMIRKLKS